MRIDARWSFFPFSYEKEKRKKDTQRHLNPQQQQTVNAISILGMRMKALHGCCWRTCSSHLNGSYLRSPSKWLNCLVLPLGLDLSSLSFFKRKKKGKIGPREPPQPGNNFSIKSLVPRAWRLFFFLLLSSFQRKEGKKREEWRTIGINVRH